MMRTALYIIYMLVVLLEHAKTASIKKKKHFRRKKSFPYFFFFLSSYITFFNIFLHNINFVSCCFLYNILVSFSHLQYMYVENKALLLCMQISYSFSKQVPMCCVYLYCVLYIFSTLPAVMLCKFYGKIFNLVGSREWALMYNKIYNDCI